MNCDGFAFSTSTISFRFWITLQLAILVFLEFHCHSKAYSELCQTSKMKIFCKNSKWQKFPSYIFDRALNIQVCCGSVFAGVNFFMRHPLKLMSEYQAFTNVSPETQQRPFSAVNCFAQKALSQMLKRVLNAPLSLFRTTISNRKFQKKSGVK